MLSSVKIKNIYDKNEKIIDSKNDFFDYKKEIKYIVTIDDIPYYYAFKYKDAINKMWNKAKQLQFDYKTYNSIIHSSNKDEINIIGHQMFLIISYDKVLHRLQVHKK